VPTRAQASTANAGPSSVHRPLVLGYHAISSSWSSNLAVSQSLLRSHLSHLAQGGYVGLTATQAEVARVSGTLPSRSVVLTFDDGYASTLQAAAILAEFGFPGTVFVVTEFMESGEPLQWAGIAEWHRPDTLGELRSLSWTDAEELAEQGWEIGSHTASHPVLTKVDDERLRVELAESRAVIERRLGACTSVAYPYGQADERVSAAAHDAGYEVGYMLTFAHIADEPWRRPRVGMGPRDRGLRLRLQVSGLGQASRRSRPARIARTLHFRRSWLPDE
jgi:peptidoglycan/xylan/chitin deacetylase (PgdA/CDA1 family)